MPPIISIILQMVVHYSMHLVVLKLPNGHDGTEFTYSITLHTCTDSSLVKSWLVQISKKLLVYSYTGVNYCMVAMPNITLSKLVCISFIASLTASYDFTSAVGMLQA